MTALLSEQMHTTFDFKLSETLFSLAKVQYSTVCFSKALPNFLQIAEQAWQREDYNQYTECLTYLLRIYLEQDRKNELSEALAKVQYLIENAKLSAVILSRAHSTLALLNRTLFQNLEAARSHLNVSLELALTSQNHKALAYPIYGSANLFFERDEFESCLAELDKLDQILNFHPLEDFKVTSLLLRAFVARDQGEFPKAFSLLHQACEQLKKHPNIYLYLQALYGFGSSYLKQGDLVSAQIYLNLAKSTCPGEEAPRLQRLLITTLNQCRSKSSQLEKSICFNYGLGVVERKGLGSLSLDSQFILRDLLQLFLINPGKSFSKEELAETIWKESYSPLHHDNKIYVTLKRLRQFLEPLFPDLDPILRSRHGYTFTKQINVDFTNGESL